MKWIHSIYIALTEYIVTHCCNILLFFEDKIEFPEMSTYLLKSDHEAVVGTRLYLYLLQRTKDSVRTHFQCATCNCRRDPAKSTFVLWNWGCIMNGKTGSMSVIPQTRYFMEKYIFFMKLSESCNKPTGRT